MVWKMQPILSSLAPWLVQTMQMCGHRRCRSLWLAALYVDIQPIRDALYMWKGNRGELWERANLMFSKGRWT
jgi:hypothetical protein